MPDVEPVPPAKGRVDDGEAHGRKAEAERTIEALYGCYLEKAAVLPGIERCGCTTPELAALLTAAAEKSEQSGEPGPLSFDVVVNAQDFDLSDLRLSTSGRPPAMQVVAEFQNFGTPVEVRYAMKKVDGRWLVDDVSSGEWALRKLLE